MERGEGVVEGVVGAVIEIELSPSLLHVGADLFHLLHGDELIGSAEMVQTRRRHVSIEECRQGRTVVTHERIDGRVSVLLCCCRCCKRQPTAVTEPYVDRKSTRLNSSHVAISYAV